MTRAISGMMPAAGRLIPITAIRMLFSSRAARDRLDLPHGPSVRGGPSARGLGPPVDLWGKPGHSSLMGQMKLHPDQAERAASLFDLDEEEKMLLQESPYRGSLPGAVPTDPLIYRFYELVQVYGTTWKELIQEEFGDGIMSAIDFDMTIERQPDPKGDRVKLTLSGKFLPYKEY
jgi:cyanate lyase